MSGNDKEVVQEPSSNPNLVERRLSLFAYLGHCIRLSYGKMMI
jgi:hypothetical protein